ncbi:helix-turn-helix domain-containing protein [Moorella stamsii]|uniref:helix-turn-helix transcriptional regulator n=1 Tax=Neomoorella stamsii TaxID=1266720 RepID=UPI001FE3D764
MRTALRRVRLQAGLTQSELARMVGLTRASYTNSRQLSDYGPRPLSHRCREFGKCNDHSSGSC